LQSLHFCLKKAGQPGAPTSPNPRLSVPFGDTTQEPKEEIAPQKANLKEIDMKKMLTSSLIAAFAFTMIACGDGGGNTNNAAPAGNKPANTAPATKPANTAPAATTGGAPATTAGAPAGNTNNSNAGKMDDKGGKMDDKGGKMDDKGGKMDDKGGKK
jgi:hypothetical protein